MRIRCCWHSRTRPIWSRSMSDTTRNPRFPLAPGASKRYGVDLSDVYPDGSVTIVSATATPTTSGISAASEQTSGQRTSFLFSGVVEAELGTTWTVDIAMTLSNGEVDVRTIYIVGQRVS